MMMSPNDCYRALVARDRRFDGLFFTGITSTGIYCRPICPARTPRRDRCRFFGSAAAAERDGFRPCLRCRPELAPGYSPADGSLRIAHAVSARIEAGALDNASREKDLAREFGMGTRQLRRVVTHQLGVAPIELAQTHRLLLAKRLLTESRLPIASVAYSSGFRSLRRFNALFRSRYGLPPSRVREQAHAIQTNDHLCLTLAYRPPMAWREMIRFLAERATAGVECVRGHTYLRTVAMGNHCGWVKVYPVADRPALAVEIPSSLLPVLPSLLARLRDLFDLNARPDIIGEHLKRDRRLRTLVNRIPGLRVPGAFDGFEVAVRAVLGQQVSVRAATTLAGRFAAAFGDPITTPSPELNRLSPTPQRIAAARPRDLKALGITTQRAACILALARAVRDGELHLHPGNPKETLAQFQALPGIGDWTGQYVALRALRWPDAFPTSDLGLLRAWGTKSPRELGAASEAWRPWRAYAAMYLWNQLSHHFKDTNHA